MGASAKDCESLSRPRAGRLEKAAFASAASASSAAVRVHQVGGCGGGQNRCLPAVEISRPAAKPTIRDRLDSLARPDAQVALGSRVPSASGKAAYRGGVRRASTSPPSCAMGYRKLSARPRHHAHADRMPMVIAPSMLRSRPTMILNAVERFCYPLRPRKTRIA
jgi:hypothetical protein